jgi:thiol:disulfide interchange protein
VIVIILLLVNYSYEAILQNGFVIGGLFVLILFLLFGRFSLKLFSKKE